MCMNINPGDILIVDNRKGGFLSAAIRFFTNSWSHTALGFFPIVTRFGTFQTIFEANFTTGITEWGKTFNNKDMRLKVYRWTKDVGMEKALLSLFASYNGNTYGAFQLLWFIWRWVVEKLHLPRRWQGKNFFPNNEICTEVVYVALAKLNNQFVNDVLASLKDAYGLDQNSVHPGDIMMICEALRNAGLLELVYER